jgi:thiol-disulfide isomerase/thioredoxin
LKHPALAGLGVGVALALFGVYAYQHLPSPGGVSSSEAVDHQRLWTTRLPDLSGREQTLDNWRGKVLVVNFWAPWCPPCRAEMPGFDHLQNRLGARGLQFVGVALDAPDKVSAFLAKNPVSYPILQGAVTGHELARAAGNQLGGLPYTLILDRRGSPVATLTGGIEEARVEALVEPLL